MLAAILNTRTAPAPPVTSLPSIARFNNFWALLFVIGLTALKHLIKG